MAPGMTPLAYRLAYLQPPGHEKAQVLDPKRASDLGFYRSRLSESNRRPIHYE